MNNRFDKQDINRLTAHLFRENSGKMVAVLSSLFGIGNLDYILDAVQDTFEAAIIKWRYSGIPENPSAWLMQVAKNKTINILKRETKTTSALPQIILPHEESPESEVKPVFSESIIADSQLQLLIACCLPELSVKNQIIITLHILCGFGIPEIAKALLMSEEAVKKAVIRTKAALKRTEILFTAQPKTKLDANITTVHTILYLLFNEGYKATRKKDGINNDLCYEAIRLAKMVLSNDPAHPETNALLALMFLNISRFQARITENGEWLTLSEQNRKLWDKIYIEEGLYYLNQAKAANELCPFYLEAMIASIHCITGKYEDTDWKKIVYLYQQLEKLKPNAPLVVLNRLIAQSHLEPSATLITELEQLETEFPGDNKFIYLISKGYLFERTENRRLAKEMYRKALDFTRSKMDSEFIMQKINRN